MSVYINPLFAGAGGSVGNTLPAAAGASSFQNVLQSAAVPAPNHLESLFAKASKTYGVPENLLKAVAKAESDFQPDCVSSAGASGIMQLMPETAKQYGITNIFDPEQNIMGGARELAGDLKRYHGDVKLALAGYNAGCGNVDKYGGIPPFSETQNYVRKVMKYMGQSLSVPDTAGASGFTPAQPTAVSGGQGSGPALGLGLDAPAASNMDFTYADYQMFIGILIDALKNGWNTGRTESGRSTARVW